MSHRVASLLPAGTEIVAALGLDLLVGISHECDHPEVVLDRPRLTWSPVDPTLGSKAIDAEVRRLQTASTPVIMVDGAALRSVRPTLLLTQSLCQVCAVVDGDLGNLAAALDPPPAILPMTGRTIDGILADVRTIGVALDRAAGAERLIEAMNRRLHEAAGQASGRPTRVLVIEWLDPIFLAGHWVPELVRMAGGIDVGAEPGSHSAETTLEGALALRPEVIVVALCGFSLERALREWHAYLAESPERRSLIRSSRASVWAIDGNGYTSRPGPRVVDAARLIQAAIAGREGAEVRRLPI